MAHRTGFVHSMPPLLLSQAGEGWMPHPVIAEAMRSAPMAAGVETPLQRAISLRTLLPNAREADGRRPYVNYRCGGCGAYRRLGWAVAWLAVGAHRCFRHSPHCVCRRKLSTPGPRYLPN